MNIEILQKTVANLVQKPKGLLAIDEGVENCNKRFKELGIPETESARREYRELLVTTPEIEKYVSGYIMYDETIRQSTNNGDRFPDILKHKGIEIGIKVDQGLEFFNGSEIEQVTKGLDGLKGRLIEYRAMYSASFTKWRVALHIDSANQLPTDQCIYENALRLAEYVKIVQEENMVPIIEPEILIQGNHDIDTCYRATARALDIVFKVFHDQEIYLPGVILKTSMVISGLQAPVAAPVESVATMTIKCLREHVPNTIGGIVFLSGGQSSELAWKHLEKMHELYKDLPWPLTFSYSRALQNDTLHYWAKNQHDPAGAQQLLIDWAQKNSQAVGY